MHESAAVRRIVEGNVATEVDNVMAGGRKAALGGLRGRKVMTSTLVADHGDNGASCRQKRLKFSRVGAEHCRSRRAVRSGLSVL